MRNTITRLRQLPRPASRIENGQLEKNGERALTSMLRSENKPNTKIRSHLGETRVSQFKK
jgi:peptide subunit release factor 1 (eRF1)